MTPSIGVVGAGVIGRSWAALFARAGFLVRVFDSHAPTRAGVISQISTELERLGEPSGDVVARLAVVPSIEAAADGAIYVQESIAEDAVLKREAFAALDLAAASSAILASSASAIDPEAIFGGLPGEARMLVAHPFNPPHLVPVVEVVAAERTATDTLTRAMALLQAIGQHPVRVAKPMPGYIGNRLQAAVVAEAMQMVARGVATPDDIDAVLRIGLGRRWSMMGPFETMDLNAGGGVAAYFARFAASYQALGRDLHVADPWPPEAMEAVLRARRQALPLSALAERVAWRDRRLWALRRAEETPDPGP